MNFMNKPGIHYSVMTVNRVIRGNMYFKNRVGEEYYNKCGYHMIITKYNSARDVEVTFDNGYCVRTTFKLIKNGYVKNKDAPSVVQHGIVGNQKISNNSKTTKEYRTWHGMLVRCFSNDYKSKKNTYKDVTCCEEWLKFENFLKWLKEQENYDYYQKNKINYQLDKDILIKGNKLYSPETCSIVPLRVNNLFIKSDKNRGPYPIGVTLDKRWNNFSSRCCTSDGKRIKHSGFKNPTDAFLQYKKDKEKLIKEIATEEYSKGSISERCYRSMINYQVEITD